MASLLRAVLAAALCAAAAAAAPVSAPSARCVVAGASAGGAARCEVLVGDVEAAVQVDLRVDDAVLPAEHMPAGCTFLRGANAAAALSLCGAEAHGFLTVDTRRFEVVGVDAEGADGVYAVALRVAGARSRAPPPLAARASARRLSGSEFKYVQIAAALDHTWIARYGSGSARLAQEMNVAKALFEGAAWDGKYSLEVVDVYEQDANGIGWTSSSSDNTYGEIADEFRAATHNGTDLPLHDVSMIMTYHDIGYVNDEEQVDFWDNGTVGVANFGALCTSDYSTMVIEDRSDVRFAGETIAHEIGHLFKLAHDGSAEDGTEDCDESRYIMAAYGDGSVLDEWSDCSVRDFNAFVLEGRACCLEPQGVLGCADGLGYMEERDGDDGDTGGGDGDDGDIDGAAAVKPLLALLALAGMAATRV